MAGRWIACYAKTGTAEHDAITRPTAPPADASLR